MIIPIEQVQTIDGIVEACRPDGFLKYLAGRIGSVDYRMPPRVYMTYSPIRGQSPEVEGAGGLTSTVPTSLWSTPVTIVQFSMFQGHVSKVDFGEYFVEIDEKGVRNIYYQGENPKSVDEIHKKGVEWITLMFCRPEYEKPTLVGKNYLAFPSDHLRRKDGYRDIPFPGLKGQK
ncbi:hypothetical protein HYU11_02185 [Candidatus Woesearchaeota archaeon]|nr:hypothetical protein [Candidatus Woesearchaeota archaeon]